MVYIVLITDIKFQWLVNEEYLELRNDQVKLIADNSAHVVGTTSTSCMHDEWVDNHKAIENPV